MEEKDKNVQQEQIHNILFNREIGWQDIIYDLINTEQLDPWNIDIIILTDKYLEKISQIEEADFFVSSKVLLAASLLLKIKTEIIMDKYIKSIDEILFGKEEKSEKTHFERIELDEEIPELVPKSPIPRFKKVTLKELMESLNKAIITENRKIKKEIIKRRVAIETSFSIPKRKFNIGDKIKDIYNTLSRIFKNSSDKKISLHDFVKGSKEEKIISVLPLLHLEMQKKIWLEQHEHFEEIYIWLKEIYLSHNPDPLEELKKELESQITNLDKEQKKRLKKIEDEFPNPVGDI